MPAPRVRGYVRLLKGMDDGPPIFEEGYSSFGSSACSSSGFGFALSLSFCKTIPISSRLISGSNPPPPPIRRSRSWHFLRCSCYCSGVMLRKNSEIISPGVIDSLVDILKLLPVGLIECGSFISNPRIDLAGGLSFFVLKKAGFVCLVHQPQEVIGDGGKRLAEVSLRDKPPGCQAALLCSLPCRFGRAIYV